LFSVLPPLQFLHDKSVIKNVVSLTCLHRHCLHLFRNKGIVHSDLCTFHRHLLQFLHSKKSCQDLYKECHAKPHVFITMSPHAAPSQHGHRVQLSVYMICIRNFVQTSHARIVTSRSSLTTRASCTAICIHDLYEEFRANLTCVHRHLTQLLHNKGIVYSYLYT